MQMPIPDDWNGEDFCKWSVCWPDSIKWKAILYGLIGQPSQGRFWDADTGNIRETQLSFLPAYDYNFTLKGVFMSCDDTNITNAFNRIADGIFLLAQRSAGSGCCDSPDVIVNNTIQGSVVQPIGGNTVPVYGSQPPLGIPEGEYPPEYETEEQYLLDKCRKAHAIVSALAQALRNLAGISVFNAIALAGLIALAIPGAIVFPPAAIGIMVGLLLTLVGATGLLANAADYIDENHEEWTCALFVSDSSETIVGRIADLVDVLIATLEFTGVVGLTIKAIILVMTSSDTLNQLFDSQGMEFYPDADCSECLGCETIVDFQFEESAESWGLASETCDTARTTTSGASAGWSSSDGGSLELAAPGGSPEAIVVVEVDGLSTDPIRAEHHLRIQYVCGPANVFSRWYVILSESGCQQVGSAGLTASTSSIMDFDLSAFEGETIEAIQGTAENSISQAVLLNLEWVAVDCTG